MKKLADFIVEKRYFIFIAVLCLTVLCVFLGTKVNINYDMTSYLPNNSETKKGMTIMETQFEEEKTSNLLVMFKDENLKKEEIYKNLSEIDGVESVKKTNKKEYILYTLQVDDYANSKKAKDVYDTVLSMYKNEAKLSGTINRENKPVLEPWIIITAISSAVVILFIMCNSYIEPLLFLFTIGIAVYINKGTNIIFDSVSNVTDSISAILQMALSMDYSIMLMNRYTQEKKNTRDNKEAMKNALKNSFTSISSSSVTTIVGLLALVFMSFTLGKDLGFVLAKGVFLSLVCIFTVLPCLILMFDKLINKTKKKSINFNMSRLGVISHNFRYLVLILIVLLFAGSYVLKGNLNYLYTDVEDNEVAEVFKENNQIALVYNNKDEDKISEICKKINNKKVNQVVCYGNTLNEKLTYTELETKLNDFEADVEMDDYLLKMVFYNYYESNKINEMTIKDFIGFIENNIYTNNNLNKYLDSNIKTDLDKLKYFALPSEIEKQRSSYELSNILGISQENIDNLLLVYRSNHTDTKISLIDFINYINNNISTNELFSKYITPELQNNLTQLNNFIDKDNINTQYDIDTMSIIFGIDVENMSKLYLYYYSINGVDTTLTIKQFTDFILNDVVITPEFSTLFDATTIENIKLLNTFSNPEITNKLMNITELSTIINMDNNTLNLLIILNNLNKENNSFYSLKDLNNLPLTDIITILETNNTIFNNLDITSINNVLKYVKNYDLNAVVNLTELKELYPNIITYLGLDENYIYTYHGLKDLLENKLSYDNNQEAKQLLDSIINYNSDIKISYLELGTLLGVDSKYTKDIYTLLDYKNNLLTSTPQEIINLLLNNQENLLNNNYIDTNTLNIINTLKLIIDNSNTNFNYNDIKSFLGLDENTTKSIYALYDFKNNNLKLDKIQLLEFILENRNIITNIDSNTINKLYLLNNILTGIINNQTYSKQEISKLLGIDSSSVGLLYSYYDKINGYQENMSLREFINFIMTDVITNSNYNNNFNYSQFNQIKTLSTVMNNSINNVSYSSSNLYNTLSSLNNTKLDNNTLDLLYLYYGSINNYEDSYKLTLEEFVSYLNNDIINDSRFNKFIDNTTKQQISDSEEKIQLAKNLLVGTDYSRVIIDTKFNLEDKDTMNFIKELKTSLKETEEDNYLVGNSPMAYELDKTFKDEFNFISLLTMILIFIVVTFTFKSPIISLILTLIIQCAVYITMSILSLFGGSVYFIALLIVQSILMGATIDYAIIFTSYYIEHRVTYNKKGALIKAYNHSIHTILTSSSVLIIVTFIVGFFATTMASKICLTISQGTLYSTLLVLFILPGVLAAFDKLIVKKN